MRSVKIYLATAMLAFPVAAHAGDAGAPDIVNVPSGPEFIETGSTSDGIGANNLSGFVEAAGGYAVGKANGYSADGTAWALRGSVNAALEKSVNLQLDAAYTTANAESLDVDTLVGAAHAYYRQPDAYAFGAYVQGGRITSSLLDVASDYFGLDDSATKIVGGVEAAVYTDKATVHGKLGFGRASYSGAHADIMTGGVGARVYANENVRLDLDAGLTRLSAYGGEVTGTTLSAVGNYRLASAPATLFAGYQYGNASANDTADVNTHAIMAGVRFSFGSKSLRDEERNGATWTATPGLASLGF